MWIGGCQGRISSVQAFETGGGGGVITGRCSASMKDAGSMEEAIFIVRWDDGRLEFLILWDYE